MEAGARARHGDRIGAGASQNLDIRTDSIEIYADRKAVDRSIIAFTGRADRQSGAVIDGNLYECSGDRGVGVEPDISIRGGRGRTGNRKTNGDGVRIERVQREAQRASDFAPVTRIEVKNGVRRSGADVGRLSPCPARPASAAC